MKEAAQPSKEELTVSHREGWMGEGGVCVCVKPTVARVGVAQGLFSVEAQADVAAVGRSRAVAGARALVVTPAAAHGAGRPGRPAGPGAVGCGGENIPVTDCVFLLSPSFQTRTVSGRLRLVLFQRGIDPSVSQSASDLITQVLISGCRLSD